MRGDHPVPVEQHVEGHDRHHDKEYQQVHDTGRTCSGAVAAIRRAPGLGSSRPRIEASDWRNGRRFRRSTSGKPPRSASLLSADPLVVKRRGAGLHQVIGSAATRVGDDETSIDRITTAIRITKINTVAMTARASRPIPLEAGRTNGGRGNSGWRRPRLKRQGITLFRAPTAGRRTPPLAIAPSRSLAGRTGSGHGRSFCRFLDLRDASGRCKGAGLFAPSVPS